MPPPNPPSPITPPNPPYTIFLPALILCSKKPPKILRLQLNWPAYTETFLPPVNTNLWRWKLVRLPAHIIHATATSIVPGYLTPVCETPPRLRWSSASLSLDLVLEKGRPIIAKRRPINSLRIKIPYLDSTSRRAARPQCGPHVHHAETALFARWASVSSSAPFPHLPFVEPLGPFSFVHACDAVMLG
jgi:hypothetical protein